MLRILLRWIIAGPKNRIDTDVRKTSLDQTVNHISQLISQAIKSERQIRYKPNSETERDLNKLKRPQQEFVLDSLFTRKLEARKL